MIATIIVGALMLVIGGVLGFVIFRYVITRKYQQTLEAADKEAEVIKEKKLLEVKEKFLNKKAELEKEVQQRNARIQQGENKLKQRELSLNQRQEELGRRKQELEQGQLRMETRKVARCQATRAGEDAEARASQTGEDIWIECRGSSPTLGGKSERPGQVGCCQLRERNHGGS